MAICPWSLCLVPCWFLCKATWWVISHLPAKLPFSNDHVNPVKCASLCRSNPYSSELNGYFSPGSTGCSQTPIGIYLLQADFSVGCCRIWWKLRREPIIPSERGQQGERFQRKPILCTAAGLVKSSKLNYLKPQENQVTKFQSYRLLFYLCHAGTHSMILGKIWDFYFGIK